MSISKVKALFKFAVGGWSGLAIYVLEVLNEALAKVDKDGLAKFATVVVSVSSATKTILGIFVKDQKKAAAGDRTIEALNTLANALEDGVLTKEELDANIAAVTACVETWKEAA